MAAHSSRSEHKRLAISTWGFVQNESLAHRLPPKKVIHLSEYSKTHLLLETAFKICKSAPQRPSTAPSTAHNADRNLEPSCARTLSLRSSSASSLERATPVRCLQAPLMVPCRQSVLRLSCRATPLEERLGVQLLVPLLARPSSLAMRASAHARHPLRRLLVSRLSFRSSEQRTVHFNHGKQ